MTYYVLDPELADPQRIRKEREKARKLKKSSWWRNRLQAGLCHYCGGKFPPKELTMDHVVPIARGGASTQGNVVPACLACNRAKKLSTPAEEILDQISGERASEAGGGEGSSRAGSNGTDSDGEGGE